MVKQGSRQIGTNRSFEAGTMAHNPCPTVDIYAHQDRVREALHHVEAKKMTLVLGMLGRDGMVMAADSRMVQPVHGERVARTTDMKLVQTGRSVVVGIVGDAVPGYRVVERVKDKV
ncbi:MAG TPA: hypothetical protein QGH10_14365, partial [Armatimonadota bacterium]|nr:hypothetical protein [Armatimonadota bacterium]